MRRTLPAVLLLALAASAGCSSTASTPSAAPTSSAPSSPAAPSGPEADACKVLAAMTFDASTMDKATTTQAQMNAALNLLPKNDPLATDVVAAEQPLVSVVTDLASSIINGSTSSPVQSDLDALQSGLKTVASDCSAQGVPFTVAVHTAS